MAVIRISAPKNCIFLLKTLPQVKSRWLLPPCAQARAGVPASSLPLRQTPANISHLLPVATRRSLADIFIGLYNNVKSSLILFGTLPIGFMEILGEL